MRSLTLKEALREISICGCSPYTLILGRLRLGPARREELDQLARILYEKNEHSCWSYEDYKIVMGFLLYSGMVKENSDGLLRLDLGDPHDVEYAEKATKACRKIYSILHVEV